MTRESQPNFTSVNPDGSIGAHFPGGITMPADIAPGNELVAPTKAVQWVRQSNGAVVAHIMAWELPDFFDTRAVRMTAQHEGDPANRYARLTAYTQQVNPGGAGATIDVSVANNSTAYQATILDNLGGSNFTRGYTFTFGNNAPPWNLDNFFFPVRGSLLTCIRISMQGMLTWPGGGPPLIWFRPNGLATISSGWIDHRTYFANPAVGHDVFGGAVLAANPGMLIGTGDWLVGAGSNVFSCAATIFTKPVNGVRLAVSESINIDASVDGNRMMRGVIASQWQSSAAEITSIAVTASNPIGTLFTGNITVELVGRL